MRYCPKTVSYTHLDVYKRQAKKYILYRNERTRVREMNTRLMKVYEDLTFKSSLENDVKRENANICLLYTSRCV